MRTVAASVHHALGDAFVIEVEDLLAKMRVLDQGGAARALLQGVLVIGNWHPLLRGENVIALLGALVGFAACAAHDGLVAIGNRRLGSSGHGCSLARGSRAFRA